MIGLLQTILREGEQAEEEWQQEVLGISNSPWDNQDAGDELHAIQRSLETKNLGPTISPRLFPTRYHAPTTQKWQSHTS